jgi:HEPN domain-containing protein
MPKDREARALMSLLDAVTDILAMECSLNIKIYPPAVFHAQQASEKAAKACIILKDDYRTGHDYMHEFREKIFPVSGKLREKFQGLYDSMSNLEELCTPSRYSVSPTRTRYRLYPEKDVIQLCESSKIFVELCFAYIDLKTGLTLPRGREELTEFILSDYRDYIDIVELYIV